jgi:DNA-binding HxlR family transcriptional regulator
LRSVSRKRDSHPQSFRLLRASADGISPSVLNTRLKELREARVVELAEAGCGLTVQGLELVRHLKPLNGWADARASEAH